jgi:hypothetical protein
MRTAFDPKFTSPEYAEDYSEATVQAWRQDHEADHYDEEDLCYCADCQGDYDTEWEEGEAAREEIETAIANEAQAKEEAEALADLGF